MFRAPSLLVLLAVAGGRAWSTPRADATAAWSDYLDGVERALAAGHPESARLRALSDALRVRRDAALAAGPGTLAPDHVRRSARLIARIEAARAAAEVGALTPRHLRAPRDERAAIFVRDEAVSAPPPRGHEGGFILDWPVIDVQVTSGFGLRPDPLAGRLTFHEGIDLAGDPGDDVRAMGPGEVVFAGWRGDGCGYTVVLRHGEEMRSEYCHLSAIDVDAGDVVSGGERLGGIGSTGRSTGHHLHWAVRIGGRPHDPTDLVGRRSDAVTFSKGE